MTRKLMLQNQRIARRISALLVGDRLQRTSSSVNSVAHRSAPRGERVRFIVNEYEGVPGMRGGEGFRGL